MAPTRSSMKIPRFNRNTGIITALGICILVACILRLLPLFSMDAGTYRLLLDPDVWYNFRQIEVMVNNFPQYNWFDPLTAYPVGKNVDWGPLFPGISALVSLLFGAAERAEIISVSSWVPVLFGVLMIPVVFSLSRLIAGWKAGVIAAVLVTVVSGEYFYRTMAGLVDHHGAEILFTTLFCLFYVYSCRKASEHEGQLWNPGSVKFLLIPSVLAGISIAAGLAVMPTTLLFALIAAIYTLLQYTWNMFHGKRTDYLFVVNTVVAVCALAVLIVIGVQSPIYSFSTYSAAPVHAFILLFCGTALLQAFSMVAREKPWVFMGLLTISVVVGIGIAAVINPEFISSVLNAISLFFGESYSQFPIEEQKPWSPGQIWASYNILIFLAFIGIILLAHRFWKKECPAHLFVLVWAAVILVSTIQHSRFEYYSTVIVVISAAATLGYAFLLDEPGEETRSRKTPSRPRKGKKEKKERNSPSGKENREIIPSLKGTGTSFVLACLIIFCGISILSDYSIATNENYLVPAQWTGVLEWMSDATPDPGVSYLGPYAESWTYPDESYGVLSWWDYGHWITFIARRIPVTNPFQDNVRPASAFFFSESEDAANLLADRLGAKYVITDWKMVDSKFPAMVTWYNASLSDAYYYQEYRFPEGNQTTLLRAPYYQTMVSRLHNFDGSFTEPDMVVYVEYTLPLSRSGLPSVTLYEVLNHSAARDMLARFEGGPHEGKGASLVNTAIDSPVAAVDALRHYRLIYEQAEFTHETVSSGTKSVKVFEYVRGAELKGEGSIEVTIETNLGRTFVYRQNSINGTFILPYATQNPEYPVKTVGPYRLLPSGRTVEVTEQDVRDGTTIAG
jgi:oligosaccharyl transferase (archaeosortase A-associated)